MNITLDDIVLDPAAAIKAAESDLVDAAALEGTTPVDLEIVYCNEPVGDDPAAPVGAHSRAPYAEPVDDWPAFQRRSALPQVELTDLMHIIDRNRPDQRRQALAEWQAHLNDGWETLNISELLDADGKITRIVVLRRECPPQPITPDPITTTASALAATWTSRDALVNTPQATITIHPAVTIPPLHAMGRGQGGGDALEKLLADHPIAAHVREHGIDATLEAMNSRARDAARAAYAERLTAHQSSRPITRIPSRL